MKILKKKSDFFRIILKNLISANLFFFCYRGAAVLILWVLLMQTLLKSLYQ